MEIAASELSPGVTLLSLSGRLNMVAAPRLRKAIDDCVEAQRPRIVIDLGSVPFIDSSGLGALIAGLKKARQASGDLRITGLTPQVETVLKLTNLDRVLRAHASVEAAADGW